MSELRFWATIHLGRSSTSLRPRSLGHGGGTFGLWVSPP